jgi:O-antigen ligase
MLQWLNKSEFKLAALVFFICGISALWIDNPIILIIPFAWVLIPNLLNIAIFKTEILFWVLIVSLPLSTEINITESLGFDFPDENILMLLTGLFIVKLIYNRFVFPIQFIKQPLFLLLTLHLIWILICCFFSVDLWLSLKYFLAKIWFIIPLVIMLPYFLKTENDFKLIAKILIGILLIIVVQTLIRHGFYEFSFDSVHLTVNPFFRNHVNYSALLACIIVICFVAYNNTVLYKNILRKILIVLLIGLFFAYSRGAIIAIVFAYISYILIKKNLLIKWIKISTVAIALLFFWLIANNNYVRFSPNYDNTIFHNNFTSHLQATIEMKDVSNAERFYRWVAGVKMFLAKPVTGFGPNNFYKNYKAFTDNRFKTYVSDNPEKSSVHNYYILLLLEQGFLGLFIFCVLLFCMLFTCQKLYNSFYNSFYRETSLCVALILIVIAAINFMSDMIETDKIGIVFWLCLGVIFILLQKRKEEEQLIA